MKLREMYKAILAIGVMTIYLVGCGNQEKPEITPTPTETPATPMVTATPTVEEGVAATPIEEDVLQTNPEDIGGEGMIDETVPDTSNIPEAKVGVPMAFTNSGGADFGLFTVQSIETSDMKIENMDDVTGKKVIVVNYSFENISAEEGILIDDMSFKLLANNNVAIPYFSPELIPAMPAGKGETATGQIAFLVDSDVKDVILVFENVSIDAKAVFIATV